MSNNISYPTDCVSQYNRVASLGSGLKITALSITLSVIFTLYPQDVFPQQVSTEMQPPRIKSNIVDGLTYADNCLYMLESTRQNDQPDCETLLEWHEHHFLQLPTEGELKPAERARFNRNLKLYNSTLQTVRKILGSKVSDQ